MALAQETHRIPNPRLASPQLQLSLPPPPNYFLINLTLPKHFRQRRHGEKCLRRRRRLLRELSAQAAAALLGAEDAD